MEPTPKYLAADLLLKGKLAAFITERRAAGKAWNQIAQELFVATGQKVSVTDVTVATWHRQLTDSDAPVEASA